MGSADSWGVTTIALSITTFGTVMDPAGRPLAG